MHEICSHVINLSITPRCAILPQSGDFNKKQPGNAYSYTAVRWVVAGDWRVIILYYHADCVLTRCRHWSLLWNGLCYCSSVNIYKTFYEDLCAGGIFERTCQMLAKIESVLCWKWKLTRHVSVNIVGIFYTEEWWDTQYVHRMVKVPPTLHCNIITLHSLS